MKKIFKYELAVQEKQVIDLPLNSEIIRVGDIDGKFFLWAIVDPSEDRPNEKRHLEFYKTGQPIENEHGLRYLGFCRLFIMQELGLYVFERTNPEPPYTT